MRRHSTLQGGICGLVPVATVEDHARPEEIVPHRASIRTNLKKASLTSHPRIYGLGVLGGRYNTGRFSGSGGPYSGIEGTGCRVVYRYDTYRLVHTYGKSVSPTDCRSGVAANNMTRPRREIRHTNSRCTISRCYPALALHCTVTSRSQSRLLH